MVVLIFGKMFYSIPDNDIHLSLFLFIYSACKLPDCWCSSDGTLIPGGLAPNDVPQIVTITFDDAINDENWKLYQSRLFPPSRKNPNGCPVSI